MNDDRIESNPLVQVSNLRGWEEEAKEFMQDEEFSRCLDLVVQVIAKPNVPQQQVAMLIVQLQAYAVKFRLLYGANMSYLKGTENASAKKNIYKYVYDGIENLVDALKYLIR